MNEILDYPEDYPRAWSQPSRAHVLFKCLLTPALALVVVGVAILTVFFADRRSSSARRADSRRGVSNGFH
jgi:hypothetical protein